MDAPTLSAILSSPLDEQIPEGRAQGRSRPTLAYDRLFDHEARRFGISPIQEIIEEARLGHPYILVDAEDRENEGDIVIPAQFATPEAVNFMAKHARGLICLAITAERARELRLLPMTATNQSSHGTAFTVSIEARTGVTTGISAHDRARTISVAVDPTMGSDDIVTPGHVFPLVAKDGGVLMRAGHTEAAVDISLLAGLRPAGVICEIMKDDGTMARLPDLIAFAQLHGLKIGTIADLIAYRRRTDQQVQRVLERPFDSVHGGHFRMIVYRNVLDESEHLVLTKGKIDPKTPTLVRVHRVDFAADMLGHVEARRDHVPKALRTIAEHDQPGLVIFIHDPDPHRLSKRYAPSETPTDGATMLRDYGVGAQLLHDLCVKDIVLLTDTPSMPAALSGFGLQIVGHRRMTAPHKLPRRALPHSISSIKDDGRPPVAELKADGEQRTVISGSVQYGRQLGRTLGFPTANISIPLHRVPRTGVYAVRSWLIDGREFDGVASLGCNPTIPKDQPVLEVWLFDFDEEIYGQLLTTQLVCHLRDEEKFTSIDALREQVFRDADQARQVLAQDTWRL